MPLPTWEQAMIQFLRDFFGMGGKSETPEGVVKMHEAIVDLRKSTEELRQKLDEHRHEYVIVGTEPIREHVVPKEYTRRS